MSDDNVKDGIIYDRRSIILITAVVIGEIAIRSFALPLVEEGSVIIGVLTYIIGILLLVGLYMWYTKNTFIIADLPNMGSRTVSQPVSDFPENKRQFLRYKIEFTG
jgi:hypothetical protein